MVWCRTAQGSAADPSIPLTCLHLQTGMVPLSSIPGPWLLSLPGESGSPLCKPARASKAWPAEEPKQLWAPGRPLDKQLFFREERAEEEGGTLSCPVGGGGGFSWLRSPDTCVCVPIHTMHKRPCVYSPTCTRQNEHRSEHIHGVHIHVCEGKLVDTVERAEAASRS